jgi:hypothetical protein
MVVGHLHELVNVRFVEDAGGATEVEVAGEPGESQRCSTATSLLPGSPNAERMIVWSLMSSPLTLETSRPCR